MEKVKATFGWDLRVNPCKMAFGIPRNKGVNFHGKFGLGIPWNSQP